MTCSWWGSAVRAPSAWRDGGEKEGDFERITQLALEGDGRALISSQVGAYGVPAGTQAGSPVEAGGIGHGETREHVVAGTRTPGPLEESGVAGASGDAAKVGSLEKKLPVAFKELQAVMTRLEKHYCDMQDIEFTVQDGKLFLLQTRNGKRTARAAVKLAVTIYLERDQWQLLLQ